MVEPLYISDRVHDTLWRIIEIFGEPVSSSQRHAIDSALTAAFDELIKAAQAAQREQLREAVIAIRADYPEDIFPGDTGSGARLACDRILALLP